jgi:hypothetical protein
MTLIYNLVPDPRFKNGKWWALNSVVTPIPEQYAVNVSNTNGDKDSFMEFSSLDVSQYRGVSMTFACSLTAIDGGATECGNGLLFVTGSGLYERVSDGGTAKVGRKTVQFTLPSDATKLNLRLYAPSAQHGTFQWWRPILTRTGDYQRMLNGIWGQPMDYFDGDLMPRQN